MKISSTAAALWNALGDRFVRGMADHGLMLFAFNPAPTAWLPGYTAGTSLHNLSLGTVQAATATLPLLTDNLANAATGDIRSVVWAFCEQLFQSYNATATANQPQELTVTKTSNTNPVNGLTTNRYLFTIVTQPSSSAVAPEGSGS
jgi:hypothetical protein